MMMRGKRGLCYVREWVSEWSEWDRNSKANESGADTRTATPPSDEWQKKGDAFSRAGVCAWETTFREPNSHVADDWLVKHTRRSSLFCPLVSFFFYFYFSLLFLGSSFVLVAFFFFFFLVFIILIFILFFTLNLSCHSVYLLVNHFALVGWILLG